MRPCSGSSNSFASVVTIVQEGIGPFGPGHTSHRPASAIGSRSRRRMKYGCFRPPSFRHS